MGIFEVEGGDFGEQTIVMYNPRNFNRLSVILKENLTKCYPGAGDLPGNLRRCYYEENVHFGNM